MIGNNNRLFVRFAFLVYLFMWWNTAINGLDAAAISKEAENRAIAATVRIYTKDYSWQSWQDNMFIGSGFFIKPHLIATNFHVISDKTNSRVMPYIAYRLSTKDRFRTVHSVKVFDIKRDLAVLEVSRSRIKPLILGGRETVERLDRVYVVGYAQALDCGITSGEINNPKQQYKGLEYIRFDAAISGGNSGGPVINLHGDVIGVVMWSYRSSIQIKPKDIGVSVSQNLNFAVPSKHLKTLLKESGVRLPHPKPPPDDAEIARRNAARKRAQVLNKLKAASVRIIGKDPDGEESLLGIGFYVEPDQVATDFHVVDGAELIGVKRFRQDSQSADMLLDAKRLKTDKARHLAILQVEKKEFKPLSLGNSGKVDRGEEIYLVRDPTRGMISEGTISKRLDIDGVQYFQLDAEVLPKTSGGPIANIKGEVIAVTALKVPKLDGTLKYAIPAIYLEGLRAKPPDPPPETEDDLESDPSPDPENGPDNGPPAPQIHEGLLKVGIGFYKAARFRDAVEALQSALNWLDKPKDRARAHLYLGFSKWGLAESKSSVSSEFREALRYNPSIGLPPEVGRSHPVFKPLFEQTRDESTGTLTITASPPETEIRIYGGEIAPELPDGETVRLRLFKGNYAVEGILGHAHKVVPVLIKPGDRQGISLTMPKTPVPEHEFEVTLDLFSAEKPKEVTVHYTIYDTNGTELNRGKKEMQLREERPESSTWVYHVKLPSAAQGGKIVYRIEADGKVIRDDPMQVEILEPPESAFIDVNQTVPIKARVISNVEVSEVRVVYDAPTALASSSPSVKLEKESSSNTYIGNIPIGRKHTDGTTWFNVTAKNKNGDQNRSATRAVRAKPELAPIKITLGPVPDPLPINKPINIKAEVKSSTSVKEVRLYYDFPRKQLSETSPSTILESKSGTDTYTGKIPKDRNRQEGYIWFFVMVTTERGMKSPSEDSVIEVRDLEPPMRQGIWASHSWSSLASNEGFYSGWERGDVLSLAFLREGKGVDTLGAQLDYTYENPDYISAVGQWGPSRRDASVVFAFLAGAAGYRSSDPEFSRVRQSRQITPILGGSMKFFPLDRVALDLSGTMKLRSADTTADRDPSFADDYLHHYEMGIRLYISPSLNLKAGYGRWRYGEYDNASVQVGLGATF